MVIQPSWGIRRPNLQRRGPRSEVNASDHAGRVVISEIVVLRPPAVKAHGPYLQLSARPPALPAMGRFPDASRGNVPESDFIEHRCTAPLTAFSTLPVNDNATVTSYIIERARKFAGRVENAV